METVWHATGEAMGVFALKVGQPKGSRSPRDMVLAWARPMPLPSATPRPLFTRRFILGALLTILVAMAWRPLLTPVVLHVPALHSLQGMVVDPTGVFDFYPLYHGGRAWLATGNAYALEAVIPPDRRNFQLYQIGNVYPFPAVMVVLPFSLLPAHLAGILWTGLLVAGLLLALRLHGWPYWYLAFMPLAECVRIEQFTAFIVIFQIVALWAWRARRPWLLAICTTLMLTKPNHALIFAAAITILAANWRPMLSVAVPFYLSSFLLQPNWVVEWVARLQNSHNVLHQPIHWQLAFFAIPLFLLGDLIGGALVLQFLMLPYPFVYATAAIPLSVIGDRRGKWLTVTGALWIIAAAVVGEVWAIALLILLPVVVIAGLRWRERRGGMPLLTRPNDAMAAAIPNRDGAVASEG